VNQSGPTLANNAVSITPSLCGKNNGAINGITFQNAIAPIFISWRNAAGTTVGNNLDLSGVVAGQYRLVFKDASGCDTIYSDWYTVPDKGSIIVDENSVVVSAVSCGSVNGSIIGVKSAGASTYTWVNVSGGTVGTSPNLVNIGAGSYQLILKNDFGCQAQTGMITVPEVAKPSFNYAGLSIANDTCNDGIGAIRGLAATDKSLNYNWTWYRVDQIGQPIAPPLSTNSGKLEGLKAGDYQVALTDNFGCSVNSKILTVVNVESKLNPPQVRDQTIPRNTSTTITVGNFQKGTYFLLDANTQNAYVLDSGRRASLITPLITRDVVYYVLLERGDCSSAIVPVNIKVFDSVKVFIPNSFSPNGDGINDNWQVIVRGLTKKMHIGIFNRWGVLVFSTEDSKIGWDGTVNGQVTPGTYVYLIDGVDFYDRPFKYRGTIVIVR
jgi:gliding motility-associated-like protein